MLVEVQEGGRFNTVRDRERTRRGTTAREREVRCASETRRGRAYVSRRQRRGALMGADAGSDWVSTRLTRAHPLLVVEYPGSLSKGGERDKEDAGKRRGSDGTLSCFAAHLSCLVSRLADSQERVLWIIIIKLSSCLALAAGCIYSHCRSQGVNSARKVVQQVVVSQKEPHPTDWESRGTSEIINVHVHQGKWLWILTILYWSNI